MRVLERTVALTCGLLVAFSMAVTVTSCNKGGGSSGGSGSISAPPLLPAGAGTGVAGLGRGPEPVDLGSAGNHVILAKSGVSGIPTSAVTGDVGLSPAAASSITGFSLVIDGSGRYATSTQVTGQVKAANYSAPTPTNLTSDVSDMETAFTDAAGRAADYTEVGAGSIGGLTLAPAVYKWGTGLLIPTSVTLSGGPNDVWIFQIAQDLTMSSATNINLSGGAKPQNIFWQVAGAVDLGTTSNFKGILLSQTAIAMKTGARITGRLLAQTAVTLDANVVTQPTP